ncbi:hypothetical protein C3F09_10715 [candidate division GN15 bacterium]|uniref:Uncharacterized protein n=1 Tax=candidate division GN15 bacterium TaxID=2072418 RepID=A0A855X160_9BACT|nr:MAG: hypothetical protein C3F09_10715 [candidate division GN15 bacterium]
MEFPSAKIRFDSQVINLLVIVVSLAAAYFMTIQSLKVELAAKAENAVVEALDKRLVGFEVILKEGTVSKSEFYDLSRGIESRLDRIEQHLVTHMGDNSGKK